MPSRSTWRVLALIVLGSLFAGAWMMTRDHNWGDDFAAYALQARSMVQGNMPEYVEKNAFTMETSSHIFGPVTEPWGYPLLLAPMYALFGLRVQGMKAVGLLCYAAMLVVFFLLARTRMSDRESLLLTAVLAFNVGLLSGTDEILSDIPFALWSTLSLWLMLAPLEAPKRTRARIVRSALLGAALFAAVFTRVAGFLLFVPLVITQLMQLRQEARWKRDWPAAIGRVLTTYAVFAVLYGLQALVFPSAAHAAPWGSVTLLSVWGNARGYFWEPGHFLGGIGFGAEALWLILLPFIVLCVVRRWRRDLPLIAYILATVGLFVVRQGIPESRYLYPIWPLLLLFAYEGMTLAADLLRPSQRSRARTFAWDVMLVMAVISLASCLQLGWRNMMANRYFFTEARGVFHPSTNRMFEYIRDKTPTDSVIIFFKPRAMRLRTERDSFFTTRCEDLPKGDFVAIEKNSGGYDQILPKEVKHCNPAVVLTPVYERDQFVVYQVSPVR